MRSSRVSSLLVNERVAIREQRSTRRDEEHNQRRAGLSIMPSSKHIDGFDEPEMIQICTALRCGRSGNVSVSQLRTLKHLLLHPDGINSFMKDRGALHGLIGELSGKRPINQLEAAYICVNLGLGKEEHCLPVCRSAGPYLIQFLEGTSYYLQEASAWAIGNIAGSSNKCAAILCTQGAVLTLIQLLSASQKGLNLAAAYALSHVIHSGALLQDDELIEIAQLSSSLLSTEPDICILLYFLSCFPVCENTLLENGVLTQAVSLLMELDKTLEKSLKSYTALLRAIANLSSGAGALELSKNAEAGSLFRTLLTSSHKHLCKESAWLCANLICHENQDVRLYAEQVGLHEAMENFNKTTSFSFSLA